MKKIMNFGSRLLQFPAIEKARDMELRVITVDMDPKAVGFFVEEIQKEL